MVVFGILTFHYHYEHRDNILKLKDLPFPSIRSILLVIKSFEEILHVQMMVTEES